MQPQGQQMGMGMQQGQQMHSMEMAPQIPSPETQLNMQPLHPARSGEAVDPNINQIGEMPQKDIPATPNMPQIIPTQPNVMPDNPGQYSNPAENNVNSGLMTSAPATFMENQVEQPKPQAAPAPPPPPNGPPFGGGPGDNNSLNVDPKTNENLNNLEKNKAYYAEKVKKYLDDLSPAELDIFKQEVNKKPYPSPMDMQGKVM